jgi:hypothetical protein
MAPPPVGVSLIPAAAAAVTGVGARGLRRLLLFHHLCTVLSQRETQVSKML